NKNLSELKKNNIIVLLESSPEKIFERTKHSNRPFLTMHKSLKDEIKEILKQRKDSYKNAADLTVNTESNNIKENAENVLSALKKIKHLTLTVDLNNQSHNLHNIVIGFRLNKEIAEKIKKMHKTKVGIVTEPKLRKLHYANLLESFKENNIATEIFEVNSGEQSKSLKEFERISIEMLEKGFDRQSLLIAFGGGVIGDLTGFVSATFMRGISFIQIPTTLLAMVDSGIGGKTAVNLGKTKNIIGAFKQPEKVFIDLDFIKTLPKEEFRNGLVEAIKTGIVIDKTLFELIEKNQQKILEGKNELLMQVIKKCCKAKIQIVKEDEKEKNLRSILNFGHTIGHAIEAVNNLSHGRAVAVGMILEARIAEKKGILAEKERKRIEKAIKKIGLNLNTEINAEKLLEKIKNDKKNAGNHIKMVLPERIGKMHSSKKVFALQIKENEILEVIKEGLK
ncbi:3-dehydroquinate synthase, partial [Candidatus Micrarchaeota archaeon]|nr:3-dehydroquinate synthase [Candidatus Micrarchaeota archaeon]